ncbi:hypothetical protein Tco_1333086, partial [Tanacetum coccineum]
MGNRSSDKVYSDKRIISVVKVNVKRKWGDLPRLSLNDVKDMGKYKALKAELALFTNKINVVSKNKSEKGLVAELFDWDEESLSFEDEGVTKVKAFIVIAEDEPAVGKDDARSGQWVEINMKKIHRLTSMTDGDERKYELSSCKSELIHLKNIKTNNLSLQNEIIRLNLDNESLRDKVSDLKKVIEKWTSSKVTLDQLLTEQVPGNIVRALGGREHPEQVIVKKTLSKLKGQSSLATSSKKALKFPKLSYLARLIKEICSKEVFGDNSLGDTERYGSVNCNGITFT